MKPKAKSGSFIIQLSSSAQRSSPLPPHMNHEVCLICVKCVVFLCFILAPCIKLEGREAGQVRRYHLESKIGLTNCAWFELICAPFFTFAVCLYCKLQKNKPRASVCKTIPPPFEILNPKWAQLYIIKYSQFCPRQLFKFHEIRKLLLPQLVNSKLVNTSSIYYTWSWLTFFFPNRRIF